MARPNGHAVGPGLTRSSAFYDSYMTEMAVSVAREHLAELIESARATGEPVYVTRRGRRVAVILDPEQYERIIDDLADSPRRPPGNVALAGESHAYRVRVGGYRSVDAVIDDRLVVQVVRVGHRREVYRR